MAATPPTFNPPRQQSGNKIWLWILLAVAMLCILMAVGLFFFARSLFGSMTDMMGCTLTGEIAKNSVIAYTLDHDGKFPDKEHWQDDVLPYYQRIYTKLMEDEQLKELPSWFDFKPIKPGQAFECEFGDGKKTGFAYNEWLSGKLDEEIEDRGVLVIYETMESKYNAYGDPDARPKKPDSRFFGEERPWFDLPLEGRSNLLDSPNSGMDFNISPEDGLEKKKDSPAPEEPEAKQ